MIVKKQISDEERFERAQAIRSWEKTKRYIAKKASRGYKSDPNARPSQQVLDDLARFKKEWNQAGEDYNSGKLTGPEKHEIDNKLYRKIKLLEKELKNLRL